MPLTLYQSLSLPSSFLPFSPYSPTIDFISLFLSSQSLITTTTPRRPWQKLLLPIFPTVYKIEDSNRMIWRLSDVSSITSQWWWACERVHGYTIGFSEWLDLLWPLSVFTCFCWLWGMYHAKFVHDCCKLPPKGLWGDKAISVVNRFVTDAVAVPSP